MRGISVTMGLFFVLGALIMFAFFPDSMPRLNLNQEGLHALSKKANRELRDGTLAEKIIKQEGTKRAQAIKAAKAGKPLPTHLTGGRTGIPAAGNGRFKRVPGTEPKN